MIFGHLELKTLFQVSQVCKEWRDVFKHKRMITATMKHICMHELWKPSLCYMSSKLYLEQFKNWRDMIKRRSYLRFDGLYACKMHYVRFGLSEDSEYRPCHDVITYKYLRFFEDGTYMQVYTTMAPKKFIPKFNPYSLNVYDMIR
mmetsp:Transcript_3346/g.5583  ORF Transcript_3346/g.5583 Transcript_3346/m.5583 type:complete len:145 (+) Transcript_3346:527-961(+)|eukprot:CAMPEP_0168610780 /NCGR_PEP_ID=MMETSP0449_2-20121227/1978_1 /TAXON_ID=1082188 /ORGANISM="Strombidium rassoulzadegani, Strain ras09" /LENGTH=144 /DNA_ID=CAMNT_0008651125 /DNA_START=472 /DNA_END=906 /DNA_ORIENTATION=-